MNCTFRPARGNNTVKEFQEDPILDQKQTSKIEMTSEEPNQITGVNRYTWSKVQFKGYYVNSTTGKTDDQMMDQLDKQVTRHTDEHVLFNLAVEKKPSVVSAITKQLSLKVGLKTWGDKLGEATKTDMR